MPPTYKPLQAKVEGIPNEVFGAPGYQSIEDFDKMQAAALAQELNNQNNQITVQDRQRKFDQENQLRNALVARYGGADVQNFNPDEALQLAQSIALQNGDLDTALAVEKATRERNSANAPLTESQMQLYAPFLPGGSVPPGTTMKDIATLSGLQRSSAYAQSTDVYANDPNRQLNADIKEKRLAGEHVGEVPKEISNEMAELDTLPQFVSNIKDRYLPYISENRGERFLAATANPNSAAYRMMKELNLVATQLAAAYNGKRLSDLDYKIASDIIQINDLDTMGTIVDKMDRLNEFMRIRKLAKINAYEKGGINMDRFKSSEKPETGQSAPFQVPGKTFSGYDKATGLPIFKIN